MGKQHIFFDLDGTLTDSMPGITRAVQYALKRYGIQVDDLNVLKPFVGPPLPESFKEFYDFTDHDAHEAVFVFREYYNVKGWMENAPFPGAEAMLQGLKDAGKELYVATSKPEDMAKRVLDHFGLTKYFRFVGGAEDDGGEKLRVKKDQVIQYVMDSCGLEKKEEIIMVGDRRHDIEGAEKTGISSVGVLYGYGGQEELSEAGADWITETPETLLELLKGL